MARVLIYESNLFWGARLLQTAKLLGHETIRVSHLEPLPADIAIVNLSDPENKLKPLVDSLRAQGTYIIGHAGHKERPLLEMGNTLGVHRVATNSEVTHKLDALLAAAQSC